MALTGQDGSVAPEGKGHRGLAQGKGAAEERADSRERGSLGARSGERAKRVRVSSVCREPHGDGDQAPQGLVEKGQPCLCSVEDPRVDKPLRGGHGELSRLMLLGRPLNLAFPLGFMSPPPTEHLPGRLQRPW